MKAQSWEQIVGLPDQGDTEVDRLRAEVRRLRAQLDRVTEQRDGYRDKWLNSSDSWRPGTYMNGL